jgi:hypothetical protein
MPTTRTLTNATPAYQPKSVETGIICAMQAGQYGGVTGSLSDTWLAVKIPKHALIVDWYLRGHGGATSTTYRLGFQHGTGSELSASVVLAATDSINRAGADTATDPLPVTVTRSDSNVQNFATIALTVTTTPSATNTGSFTLAIFYTMDGTSP